MAPRAGFACVVWLLLAPAAQAQPCDCCATTTCDRVLVPPPELVEPPGQSELRAVQGAAIATGLASWIVTTALASQQKHFVPWLDGMPVLGGITSAVRNDPSHDVPLLLFTASAQVMSILVAVVSGVEMASERQRWNVTVGATGDGAGAMLGGRF
jgi:hypothetical protein